MRVLWMSSVSPLPLTDGNRHRHFHLLRETAREHQVVLVCPASAADRAALDALARLGVQVNSVSGSRRFRGRLVSSARREPACLVPPEIDQLSAAGVAAGRFDVSFGALSVAPAVMHAAAQRRVLDDQNVEAELYDRLWRTENLSARKLARFLDWRAVRRFERRWLRAPDAVTACSRRDVQQLARLTNRQRFYVVPNGVDLDAIHYRPDDRQDEAIVFVGSMSWAPNVEAAQILALEIMPVVWQRRPGAQLWLVGKDPVPKVRGLARRGITVTGAVDSVVPYLHRASLTVVPLRSGGGTRLKILEAMAAGLPVVSTSIGAEGLDLRAGVEAVVTDSADEIAAATLRLLEDRGYAAALSRAARARVEADFGWPAIGRQLAAALSSS